MVYCGKPSRGCQNCKTRRIKCDEARPHCLNCRRTRRECPGYPQEFDLIFRNETPGARKRVKKAAKDRDGANALVASTSLEDSAADDEKPAVVPQSTIILWSRHDGEIKTPTMSRRRRIENGLLNPSAQTRLNPAIELQATTFFFRNFILPSRGTDSPRGFLELAIPMFDKASEDSPLHLATQAVAVAIIANWPGRKHLGRVAARFYGRALAQTQRAIQNPKDATSDETLLSILLFSLYEAVITSDYSPSAWSRHIDGAVAVVRARGLSQLKNPRSLLLFRTTRAQMLANAIHSQKDIPDFPGMKGWASDLDDDHPYSLSRIEFSVRLPSILHRGKLIPSYERTPENIDKVEALLKEADEVQHALAKWEANIPAQWSSRFAANVADIVDLDNVEEMQAWPGPMHLYNDVHISTARNNDRANHMLCSTVVIDCLKWLRPTDYQSDERFCFSRSTIRSLVDDLCYSVPFHMWQPGITDPMKLNKVSQQATEAVGGYYLSWPLHVASSMEVIPELQRRWLQGRLWAIGRHYGLDRTDILPEGSPRTVDPQSPPTDGPHSEPPHLNYDTIQNPAADLSSNSAQPHRTAPPAQPTSTSRTIAQPSQPPRNPRDTALQGTKSAWKFVQAADLVVEMTKTMDMMPSVRLSDDSRPTPGSERGSENGLFSRNGDSRASKWPVSQWQNGMWASVIAMVDASMMAQRRPSG